jgi:hypothetical protein
MNCAVVAHPVRVSVDVSYASPFLVYRPTII